MSVRVGLGRHTEQRVWIDWLERHGADVAVWKPSDWPLIERTL
jgi:hypothetical protein